MDQFSPFQLLGLHLEIKNAQEQKTPATRFKALLADAKIHYHKILVLHNVVDIITTDCHFQNISASPQ